MFLPGEINDDAGTGSGALGQVLRGHQMMQDLVLVLLYGRPLVHSEPAQI